MVVSVSICIGISTNQVLHLHVLGGRGAPIADADEIRGGLGWEC